MPWYYNLDLGRRIDDVNRRFDEINRRLDVLSIAISQLRSQHMIDTSKLLAAVASEKTVDDSIIALLNGVSASLKDVAKQLADAIASNDPAALAAVQAQLDTAAGDLASEQAAVVDAVNANSPPPAAPVTP